MPWTVPALSRIALAGCTAGDGSGLDPATLHAASVLLARSGLSAPFGLRSEAESADIRLCTGISMATGFRRTTSKARRRDSCSCTSTSSCSAILAGPVSDQHHAGRLLPRSPADLKPGRGPAGRYAQNR